MAKKLTLKIDALRIERFDFQPAVNATPGTVHGFGDTNDPCGPVSYSDPYRFCYPGMISDFPPC